MIDINFVDFMTITENKMIANQIYKMQIALPDDYPRPQAGQFVNVYLNDKSKLLPRPLSVCDFETGNLTLVYAVAGEGTRMLSDYAAGTTLRVSTPLGNGFTIKSNGLLVGGGLGVVPMLYLSKQMPEADVVLGFQSETFLTDLFPRKPHITTDDGSHGFKGNVLDYIKSINIPTETNLYACGPRPMLSALSSYTREKGLSLQVSLEERMGCGYGACVGCVCKTQNGNRKVCEDGPVFDGSEVNWDG